MTSRGLKFKRASSVTAFKCNDENCPCIHLALLDNNGKAFAEAALAEDDFASLAREGFKLMG